MLSRESMEMRARHQRAGFLWKLPMTAPNSEKWQKRLFMAKDGFLLYYGGNVSPSAPHFDTKPKGVIPLGGCKVELVERGPKGSKFGLKITHPDFYPGRALTLCAESAADQKGWQETLNDCSRVTMENALLGDSVIEKLRAQGTATEKEKLEIFEKLRHQAQSLEEEKARLERERIELAAMRPSGSPAASEADSRLEEGKLRLEEEKQRLEAEKQALEAERRDLERAKQMAAAQDILEARKKVLEDEIIQLEQRRVAQEAVALSAAAVTSSAPPSSAAPASGIASAAVSDKPAPAGTAAAATATVAAGRGKGAGDAPAATPAGTNASVTASAARTGAGAGDATAGASLEALRKAEQERQEEFDMQRLRLEKEKRDLERMVNDMKANAATLQSSLLNAEEQRKDLEKQLAEVGSEETDLLQERMMRKRLERKLQIAEESLKRLDAALRRSSVKLDVDVFADVKTLMSFFEERVEEVRRDTHKIEIMKDALKAKRRYLVASSGIADPGGGLTERWDADEDATHVAQSASTRSTVAAPKTTTPAPSTKVNGQIKAAASASSIRNEGWDDDSESAPVSSRGESLDGANSMYTAGVREDEQGPLPPNWTKQVDEEGDSWYYNEVTTETSWLRPNPDGTLPPS